MRLHTDNGTETFISFYFTGWLVWKYFGLRRVMFKGNRTGSLMTGQASDSGDEKGNI